MKNIKISACVICRNEEKNIGNWLHNVNDFADEIIVVDTGSIDRTKEICSGFGVKCYQYKWNDDFAAAKNYAISKATGEWIVFTDTDELFYHPAIVRDYLTQLTLKISNNDNNIEAIMVPISNVDTDANEMEIYRFNALRIFRNIPQLRYFGKIHEALANVATPGDSSSVKIEISDNRLLVKHTGYSSSAIKEKIKRNMDILNKEIESIGLQERHYYYLTKSFYAIGDYAEALKYSKMAMESTVQSIGERSDMLWVAANSLEELQYSFEKRKEFLKSAIHEFPDIPDFYALLGILLRENGQYDEAITYLENAIARADTGKASHINSIITHVHTALGQCYWVIGKYDDAKNNVMTALYINKWNDDALLALAEIYGNIMTDELSLILQKLYGRDVNEYRLMQQIYSDNGILSLSDGIFEKEKNMLLAGKHTDLHTMLLKENAEYIQYLFVSLLGKNIDMASEMDKKQLSMLPDRLSDIVLMYHDEAKKDVDYSELLSSYKAMLSAVIFFSDNEIKKRYANLAGAFGVDVIKSVAEQLRNSEIWEYALLLYQQVPAEVVQDDELFWLGAGVCFYHLRQYDSATECLSRAINVCNEKKDDHSKAFNEAISYLSWCEEVLA